ncbi:MAG: TonB-dependent receptor [Pseudomonadota bacterium]
MSINLFLKPVRRSIHASLLILALAMIPVLLFSAGPVMAQTVSFSIPAGSLGESLNRLAAEAGISLSYTPQQVAGKSAPALNGSYTVDAALEALLDGSGLSAEPSSGGYRLVSSTMDLNAIIVQGELQARSLMDTPTSVAVETGEVLESRGDRDVFNLVERLPNVSTTFGNKGFVVRGIQATGSGNNQNGQLVSVQVDGVALGNGQASFFAPYSTWDADQFEVLRGPQSTQQGRSSLAGAVIINTRDPIFDNEFRVRTEVASRDSSRLAVAGNLHLLEDELALRLVGETSETDGWVTSEPLDDDQYDAREYDSYRAKLRWQPTDDLDTVLSLSNTESTGGEDYVIDDRFPEDRVSLQNVDALEGAEHDQITLDLEYRINPTWTLVSQTSSYEQDYDRIEGDIEPLSVTVIEIFGGTDVIEQDIQLQFDQPGLSGVVGFFYTEIEASAPTRTALDLTALVNPAFPVNTFTDIRNEMFDTDVENTAIYAEVDIDADAWARGLSFTLGARYDREDFSFVQSVDFEDDVVPGLSGGALADVPERKESYDFDAFLPKLGVHYALDSEQTISATLQRAYRAGGVSANIVSSELSELDPEYTTNLEFAYRGNFPEKRMTISANVFFTKWEDQQVSVVGNSPISTLFPPAAIFDFNTENAGESELYGFEFVITGEPTDHLTLFASVGFLHTEYIDFEDSGSDFSGNEFPFAPSETAAFGGEYDWKNGWSAGVDASFKAASYQDNANTYKDDERWLLNTRVTLELKNGLTTGLFVRNLLDEDYATARFESTGQPTTIRTGEPRTVGLFLTAEFF